MSELKPCANTECLFYIPDCPGAYVCAGYMHRNPAEPNEPLTLIFGDGDIGVSTANPIGDERPNEVVLWNPHKRGAIGGAIPISEGTTTDDLDVFARLIFKNSESVQVVIDALNRVIDAHRHKPESED